MKALNELKLKYENFIGEIESEKNIIKPKYSLHENVKEAYENFLPEKIRGEVFFYKNSSDSFEKLKIDFSKNDELASGLKLLLNNYSNYYEKLDKDNEIKVISKQSYIKIKEKDYEHFTEQALKKEKEKKGLIKKRNDVLSEIDSLYSSMDDECRKYVETIKNESILKFKDQIFSASDNFFDLRVSDHKDETDYENTEEFINSLYKYKHLYKSLAAYKNIVIDNIEHFKKSLDFEVILKGIKDIQNKVFEKTKELTGIEEQINRIEDIYQLGRSFKDNIEKAKRELDEQKLQVEKDAEVQKLGALVMEFINSAKILS